MFRLPPSAPLPSDRLRVGECVIEVALRKVHAPGAVQPRRITPKSLSVLLVLAENVGRVVTRDALLAQVWPETLPTNDVVTQAITQLRKAFAGDRDAAYIETIAKSGYRLLAPVQWLSPVEGVPVEPVPGAGEPAVQANAPVVTDSPDIDAGDAAPRPRFSVRAVAATAAAMIALLVLAVLWARSQDAFSPRTAATGAAPVAQARGELITSSPGFELSPSLSPDAAMVAYMAVPPGKRNIAIMVQTTAPIAPRQLTFPDDADDGQPRWSPDGREVAFVRLQSGSGCHLLVVPVSGGPERRVGACDPQNPPSFDWTPDGRSLIVSNDAVAVGDAGLRVLDLASGQWRSLDYGAQPEDVDFAPHYSPDGRWIVFVRNSPLGDFWRLPAAGGTAERLTRMNAEIRGWDWGPDGNSLIYARRNESESRLYQLDLGTGATLDLGIVDGEDPTVAASVPAMAYVRRRSYFGIYRFHLDGADGAMRAERLFASSGRDRLPAIAPDGRQLVFASDRSGDFGLWWGDIERPGSLGLIPGVRPESRYMPSWSADSSRVLVAGSDDEARPGIFEVLPGSARVTRLPIPLPDPVQALYLPSSTRGHDERLLVVADGGDGRLGLALFDRTERPWRQLAMIDDVSMAQVDPVGQRLLFTRPGQPGLWQADLALSPGSIRRIDAESPVGSRSRAWVVAGDGELYATRWTADCPAQLQQDVPGAEARREPRCLDPRRRAATHGFSVNARTGQAFFTLAEWDGADIGFMALEVAARGMWHGTIK